MSIFLGAAAGVVTLSLDDFFLGSLVLVEGELVAAAVEVAVVVVFGAALGG